MRNISKETPYEEGHVYIIMDYTSIFLWSESSNGLLQTPAAK